METENVFFTTITVTFAQLPTSKSSIEKPLEEKSFKSHKIPCEKGFADSNT